MPWKLTFNFENVNLLSNSDVNPKNGVAYQRMCTFISRLNIWIKLFLQQLKRNKTTFKFPCKLYFIFHQNINAYFHIIFIINNLAWTFFPKFTKFNSFVYII